jgi:hypothetical protein
VSDAFASGNKQAQKEKLTELKELYRRFNG